MKTNRQYHLSATSIAAFKACPTRFRLGYREGLRLDSDTDTLRMGTNWHKMHETYGEGLQAPDGGWAAGEEHDAKLAHVSSMLADRYASKPTSKAQDEWDLERTILWISFVGYWWYWQNDPIDFLANELPFELPLTEPQTGMFMPIKEVVRVGKIDHLVKWQGAVCVLERKSTSSSIEQGSKYWEKSKKDTQVSMYALAFRDMGMAEELSKQQYDTARIGNTLYDVWHKPTIKPKTLTQAETATLIESGLYQNTQFEVTHCQEALRQGDGFGVDRHVTVDGVPAVVEEGKKGFAVRETITMYGARLLQDIYERPDFYYARREIARTTEDVEQFQSELFAVYQAQRAFERSNCWFSNESQCRATFACPYIPICYGDGGAAGVCDGESVPAGFKRIFVDLTVNGDKIGEEE